MSTPPLIRPASEALPKFFDHIQPPLSGTVKAA
jgi:hypothetical protein